jgi:hypothetical protein
MDGNSVRTGSALAETGPPSPVALRTLRIQHEAPRGHDGDIVLVLDPAWLPPPTEDVIVSTIAATEYLACSDPLAASLRHLDTWAADAGVTSLLTVQGASFWPYGRLVLSTWLRETLIWLGILTRIVETRAVGGISCADDVDPEIVDAARMVAIARGLPFEAQHADVAAIPLRRRRGRVARMVARTRRRVSSLPGMPRRLTIMRRRRALRRRMDRLAREGRHPLLVLTQHASQRIELVDGPRSMNVYLGPIIDRLRGTGLEPVEFQVKAAMTDDAAWEAAGDRVLLSDTLTLLADPGDEASAASQAATVADRIQDCRLPFVVNGVDLGPVMAERLADHTRRSLGRHIRGVARARGLLRALSPAGLLLAVEYNRPDWLAAARAEGIPIAAVQHGIIHDRHPGYMHAERTATSVLADRTYVFGRWERELLVDRSIYRQDEVIVSGSPRLDLVTRPSSATVDIRAALGLDDDERLVVISGTWGAIYRRFYLPAALAALIDRPLPGVHLVVKLHPGEPDEGPYRRVIEHAAAARGFASPRVSVVRDIDLYRLLAAADAHIGIHSTVLTEAVAVGTLNLIVDRFEGSDLLGYVAAGVAVPVRTGQDVLSALDDREALLPSERRREAFLRAHFDPGGASRRIADDLSGWLRVD